MATIAETVSPSQREICRIANGQHEKTPGILRQNGDGYSALFAPEILVGAVENKLAALPDWDAWDAQLKLAPVVTEVAIVPSVWGCVRLLQVRRHQDLEQLNLDMSASDVSGWCHRLR